MYGFDQLPGEAKECFRQFDKVLSTTKPKLLATATEEHPEAALREMAGELAEQAASTWDKLNSSELRSLREALMSSIEHNIDLLGVPLNPLDDEESRHAKAEDEVASVHEAAFFFELRDFIENRISRMIRDRE